MCTISVLLENVYQKHHLHMKAVLNRALVICTTVEVWQTCWVGGDKNQPLRRGGYG
jgi:hypothetical protein